MQKVCNNNVMNNQTIDMHCDTLMKAYFEEKEDIFECPSFDLDIKRMVDSGMIAQFFAIFIPSKEIYKHSNKEYISDDEYIEKCIFIFNNTVNKHQDVVGQARCAKDILNNVSSHKVSALLSMEDGVAVQGDMNKLDYFFKQGVRALSLTWNYENCFGYPNNKDAEIMNKGLKDFGKEAVKHMQDIGMLVDVSHLSDGGFEDVYKLSKVPFVATHSNARALCNHTRNMTDDMIQKLYEKGGVMGINICPDFLDDTPGNKKSRLSDLCDMIEHEKEIAGIEVCAVGTDIDGTHGEFEVCGPTQMTKVYDELIRRGFTTKEIDMISHENVLRVLNEAVKGE